MTKYLSYTFEDTNEFINTFDELPFWSAAFGLLLLKHVNIKKDFKVIDVGCGAGFPLLELAGRYGESCKFYGIDPWQMAINRTRQKIKNYGLSNVEIIESSTEQIPLPDNFIDLIVSNLGINNFENPQLVFKESYRVLKHGGRLALTTNINGHWKEFYEIFEETLNHAGEKSLLQKLKLHQEHRGSVNSISDLFTVAGFHVCRIHEEKFEMKFLDGTAFLNHYFVKLGWLKSWIDLLPEEKLQKIFSALEQNLNAYAAQKEGLVLSVPMLFIEGEKV